ncbi:hypothetical protein TNCV_3858331 [Trichonephila clavipes]|nr:hypothetical protein TNCV_3858331 [Trichonephila clavipes]
MQSGQSSPRTPNTISPKLTYHKFFPSSLATNTSVIALFVQVLFLYYSRSPPPQVDTLRALQWNAGGLSQSKS